MDAQSKPGSGATQRQLPFEQVALVLQGGGALGAYQAGVYEALAEADLDPDWVADISIGDVNAALIAGNAPEDRVAKLRSFWEGMTSGPGGAATIAPLNCLEAMSSARRIAS